MTPTARSLKLLRDSGYIAAVVEKTVPYNPNIKQDLFGFCDIVAVKPLQPVLFIQTTSLSNLSARIKKAKGRAELAICLLAGISFEVHGWYQMDNGRWSVKRVAVREGDQKNIVLEAKRRGKRKQEPDLFSGAGMWAVKLEYINDIEYGEISLPSVALTKSAAINRMVAAWNSIRCDGQPEKPRQEMWAYLKRAFGAHVVKVRVIEEL